MLKTIVEFVNTILIDLAKHKWLQLLAGPLLPDIGFVDVTQPVSQSPLRLFLPLKDTVGPAFQLMNRRQEGFEDFEKPLRKEILKHLPEDGVFFDSQANMGIVSTAIAIERPRARVFAFESEPINLLALDRTKTHNLLNTLEVIPVRLGEGNQLKTFFTENGQKSRMFSSLDHVMTLLALSRLDVLKIESHGSETDILKGAKTTIEKHAPIIIVSFNFKERSEVTLIEFMKTLKTQYQFYEPGTEALSDISELENAISKRKSVGSFYGDYVFIKRP